MIDNSDDTLYQKYHLEKEAKKTQSITLLKGENRIMEEDLYEITEQEDKEIQEAQEADEEFSDNKITAYDLAVFYNTYNLSTLLKWWDTGKLVVPEFQRSYVWGQKKASEFVDSMLRGLPIPSMFFYEDVENNRYLVIDGQQRMRSLFRYMRDGKFDDKTFKLKGNIHPNWKDKSYNELEQDDRDRLDDSLMNITVMRQIMPGSDQSVMYLAFQRINTGGVTLKAQEIRMAVSYGDFAKYLNELSMDKRFNKWKFLRSKSQITNNNSSPIQEFILKFWTYYFTYPKFQGSSTREMLDIFFAEQKDFDAPKKKKQGVEYHSKEEFEEAFNAAFDDINSLSIDDITPFDKPTQTFLETIWVGLTYRKLKEKKSINRNELPRYISQWKESLGEERFSELFQSRRTSSAKSVKDRITEGINYFKGDF